VEGYDVLKVTDEWIDYH